jgi:hypothetical protein
LAVGSSASTSCGAVASARAIATRWRWPPESWPGRCRACWRQADGLQQIAHAFGPRCRPRAEPQAQRILDVFVGIQHRQQIEVLEDEADMSQPEVRARVIGQPPSECR